MKIYENGGTNTELNGKSIGSTDDELKNVAGGSAGISFSGHVGKYDAQPGEEYRIVYDKDNSHYGVGYLVRSYEKDGFLWTTTRTHVFTKFTDWGMLHWVEGLVDYKDDGTVEISGDKVTLYTSATQNWG